MRIYLLPWPSLLYLLHKIVTVLLFGKEWCRCYHNLIHSNTFPIHLPYLPYILVLICLSLLHGAVVKWVNRENNIYLGGVLSTLFWEAAARVGRCLLREKSIHHFNSSKCMQTTVPLFQIQSQTIQPSKK